MNSLFKESAEEMVNRLFDGWLAKNTFDNNPPLTSPVVRQSAIDQLKKVDKRFRKIFKPEDDMVMIQSVREHCVLLDLTQSFAIFLNAAITGAPQKPTHRQTHQKQNHLLLVANG